MLTGWVRVVALPGDPFSVHLVAEASIQAVANQVDYRAPVTACGLAGYRETTRTQSACPECERAAVEATESAVRAFACRLIDLEAV